MSDLSEELFNINLGDKRRNDRACKLIEQLGSQPGNSIPTATGGWGETKAAYNLFSCEQVTPENILEPHYKATLERIKSHPVVLIAEDTTELDYSKKTDIEGLGTLNYDTRHGLYLHPALAITPERLSLGLVDNFSWLRQNHALPWFLSFRLLYFKYFDALKILIT